MHLLGEILPCLTELSGLESGPSGIFREERVSSICEPGDK